MDRIQHVIIFVYLVTIWNLFQLKEVIEGELRRSGLQVIPFTLTKIIQLYETKNSRHSSMLVGKTGSGKSVTWKTLQRVLTSLHQQGESGFQPVQVGANVEHTGISLASAADLMTRGLTPRTVSVTQISFQKSFRLCFKFSTLNKSFKVIKFNVIENHEKLFVAFVLHTLKT